MKIRGPRSEIRNASRAFTLIEVMIAMFIFSIVAFAVLELVAVSLGAARALQMPAADPGMVAAELSLSNNLVEETVSGDFDLFPNYSWTRDVYEVHSNGLYQVDITVVHNLPRRGLTESKMSVLMFRAPTGIGGQTGRRLGGR
jgi:prepilin-type N-terminal cleavage/methylation domain-containing protein